MERPKAPVRHRGEHLRKKVVVVSAEPGPDYDLVRSSLDKYLAKLDDPIIMVRSTLATNGLIVKWAGWNWFMYQVWHVEEGMTPAERNQQMIDQCDYLVAFYDGQCKSTKKMIDLADENWKLTRVVKI